MSVVVGASVPSASDKNHTSARQWLQCVGHHARRLIHRLLPVCLLWQLLPVHAAEIRFHAPEELQELVSTHISLTVEEADADDATVRQTLLLRAGADVADLLATEGYFTSTVQWRGRLAIDVLPGPVARIGSVQISVQGPLADSEKEKLIAAWKLPGGAPFKQSIWSSAKQELVRALSEHSYPAASLVHSEARVDRETRLVDLTVAVRSGPRHVYGPVVVEGLSRYDASLVTSFTDVIKPGAPYRRDDLLTLQTGLQGTPYFSTVSVNIDSSEADTDETIVAPVRVRLVERAQHRVSFGIGASSNTGPRAQVSYLYPDLFYQAWDFGAGIIYEKEEQTLFSDIFLPRKVANEQDSFGAQFEHSDINDLEVFAQTYSVGRSVTDDRLETRYKLTFEHSTEQPGRVEETSRVALVPSLTWTWRKVNSLTKPTNGGNYYLDLAGSTDQIISDTSMLFVNARVQYFYPLAEQLIWIVRGELGATVADNVDDVPQRYLFRTGGSNSIRGYDYQDIGEIVDGAVVGAERLAVLSTEWNYWLNDTWGVALFYDIGDAATTLSMDALNAGYGIGARLSTPAGPFSLDIAQGDEDDRTRYHFSIAIAF